MKSKLSAILMSEYPKLFFPSGQWEIECGRGWFPIILESLGLIDDMRRRTGWVAEVSRIAEKAGSLQIICNLPFLSYEQILLESAIAHLSTLICGACGKSAIPDQSGRCATCSGDNRKAIGQTLWPERDPASGLMVSEREGLQTCGLVRLSVRRISPEMQGQAELFAFEYPDNLVSLRSVGLLAQGRSKVKRGTIRDLHNEIRAFSAAGKTLLVYSDCSMVAMKVFEGVTEK
ncbi:hypothetical protein SAMN04487881_0047 [Marinobacter sp. es.048]|uniref:hypothetical protein n=1 Tax=Marinobacter sp. es.048 TaxID=1761795 RepID=UPI000B59274A|nr:hypothetical protein [Marinobacter sp. es.048]SNC59391.1 hypothetical protein SAMN04487881_0047 [Marinobacter sp. es.048]